MQVHIKEVWMLKLQFQFLLDYFPVSTNLKDFLPARVDSSDERDVPQIGTEEFQDSDDSEIGYWSKGGERAPCESELYVVERSSPVQIDSVANEFSGTKPYLHSDK